MREVKREIMERVGKQNGKRIEKKRADKGGER